MDRKSFVLYGGLAALALAVVYSHISARNSFSRQIDALTQATLSTDQSIQANREVLNDYRTTIDQLRVSVENLERRMGLLEGLTVATDEEVSGAPGSDDNVDLAAIAADSPQGTFYRSLANPASATAMGAISARNQYGSFFASLDLPDETKRAANQILTELIGERLLNGMNVVIDGDGVAYLESRATQAELDDLLRESLAPVLQNDVIEDLITHQHNNRRNQVQGDLAALEPLMTGLGLSDSARGSVQAVLGEEMYRALAVDAPTLTGAPPQPMAVVASGYSTLHDSLIISRQRLESELAPDQLVALDQFLNLYGTRIDTMVDAAWVRVEQNAGEAPN